MLNRHVETLAVRFYTFIFTEIRHNAKGVILQLKGFFGSTPPHAVLYGINKLPANDTSVILDIFFNDFRPGFLAFLNISKLSVHAFPDIVVITYTGQGIYVFPALIVILFVVVNLGDGCVSFANQILLI